jgi:catabolite repression HPr-like protein
MGMMTLDLDNGQAVTVEADGKDEDDALDGIEGFLKGTRTTD